MLLHASCTAHASFLFTLYLLLLRGFSLSLLGIIPVKQWLLLALSLWQPPSPSFFGWFPYKKNPQQVWSSQRAGSRWYFSSFKITAWRKGFVWFLGLDAVTYFRLLYLAYVFVPCIDPNFSVSQICLSTPGYQTGTITTTPPSLTFIPCKVLSIITTFFSVVVIWPNYTLEQLRCIEAWIWQGKLNTFWSLSVLEAPVLSTQYSLESKCFWPLVCSCLLAKVWSIILQAGEQVNKRELSTPSGEDWWKVPKYLPRNTASRTGVLEVQTSTAWGANMGFSNVPETTAHVLTDPEEEPPWKDWRRRRLGYGGTRGSAISSL